jgi:phage gp45-like
MTFQNNPKNDSNLRPSYSHQPLTFDHFGTHVKIHENGKVTITCLAKDSEEFDEVEVSASLIFLIAKQLKLTRNIEFVSSEKK